MASQPMWCNRRGCKTSPVLSPLTLARMRRLATFNRPLSIRLPDSQLPELSPVWIHHQILTMQRLTHFPSRYLPAEISVKERLNFGQSIQPVKSRRSRFPQELSSNL